MVRLVLTVALALVSFTTAALAICPECPFPLAKLYGSWQSKTESELTLIVTEKARRNGYVHLQVVVWDDVSRTMIGVGETTVDKDDTSTRIQINYQNGETKTYILGLNPDESEIVLDRGYHTYEGTCYENEGCFRFTKQIRLYQHQPRRGAMTPRLRSAL